MFQRAMGMLLVVMLERDGQIAGSSRCVRRRHEGDVVAFHRLHEALGRPVTLRAAHRRGQWLQADGHSEPARVVSRVARTVVAQPLDFGRGMCVLLSQEVRIPIDMGGIYLDLSCG